MLRAVKAVLAVAVGRVSRPSFLFHPLTGDLAGVATNAEVYLGVHYRVAPGPHLSKKHFLSFRTHADTPIPLCHLKRTGQAASPLRGDRLQARDHPANIDANRSRSMLQPERIKATRLPRTIFCS